MPVDLLISPPCSGKTEACVQRVRSLLLGRPFAPIRVVLPDRLQCAAFRRRLAEAGGALAVQVGTFGDLYRELLARAGSPAPLASTPMVHRMVQSAVEVCSAAGDLPYYAALRGTAGFPVILREAFAELKRALVLPADFSRLAADGSPAQQELAALYQVYQNRLRSLGLADPEGLSWLAVEALQAKPGLAQGVDFLVVDGFDSFTGAQRRALCLLAEQIPDILVTLPGEFPFRRAAHRRFAADYHELAECLPLTVRTLAPHSHLPDSLGWVEKQLYESNPPPALLSADLTLLEARSPAEEAREALRWLKARILRDGILLSACAVVTPDPDLYHPYLRQAAAEFGVPMRFTQGEVLAHSPAVTALSDLLNLPAQNFPRRLLLDALRSPYFDFYFCKLDARSAEILDLASSYGQIIAGRDQWDEVLERLARSEQSERVDLEEEGETRPALPTGQRAQDLWTALSRLFTRLEIPAGDQSMTAWTRWLEDLLDELRFYQSGTGELDESVFEQLREALRALVGSEAVLGSASMDYSGFLTELWGTLDSMGYREPLSGRQPAVLVLRMMEARGVRFQAVAVLGLSEGIFPAVERADPFMAESLRSKLGLESRLQREQAGLFYQAVTRADRFLLLTRPYLADDGETWVPSPYWKAVQTLFVEESVIRIRPDDARSLAEAASPEEALFWSVRRRALPPAFAELRPRWEHIGHGHAVLQARQAKKAAGPFEGYPQGLVPALLERYGPGQTWSASRLESYGTCPHGFFVSYALGLEAKEAPEPGYNAAQLGTLLHAVLEHAYREAADPADAQSVLATLPEVARREFASAPREYGFRPSPLWQTQQQQLLDVLQRSIEGLAEEDAAHGWVPYAYERQFGRGGAPALEAPFGAGSIRIAGLIDRVDRDGHGRLRIIDYKTGSSHLGKEDLLQGRRLQLPLYALAASQALELGLPEEGFYWMILRGAASPLKLSRFECEAGSGPQAAVQVVLGHIERMVNSIFQAEFPPQPPKGGCPGYCPARSWCWRYAPGWGAA